MNQLALEEDLQLVPLLCIGTMSAAPTPSVATCDPAHHATSSIRSFCQSKLMWQPSRYPW
jgi:hypothetical protein